jgi:hypothetical protein
VYSPRRYSISTTQTPSQKRPDHPTSPAFPNFPPASQALVQETTEEHMFLTPGNCEKCKSTNDYTSLPFCHCSMLPDFDSNEPFLFSNNTEPVRQEMETSPEAEHPNYTNVSSPYINERVLSPKSDAVESAHFPDSSFIDPAMVSKQGSIQIPASPTESYAGTHSSKGSFDPQTYNLHDSMGSVQSLRPNNGPLIGMFPSPLEVLWRKQSNQVLL